LRKYAYVLLVLAIMGFRPVGDELTFLGFPLGRFHLLHRDWTGAELVGIAALLWGLYAVLAGRVRAPDKPKLPG
jgi:hypothetical protein